jgi:hypothetical protein
MSAKCLASSLLFFGCFSASAAEAIDVPSDPATWYGDFLNLIAPTKECPGGTVEQLRKYMYVSDPISALDSGAAQRFPLQALRGIEDSDGVHEFYFSSELPGGSFWGFGGHLISRGACVIHAKVTTIDN